MLIKFEDMKVQFFFTILKSMFNLVNIKLITWGGGRKFESYSTRSIQVYLYVYSNGVLLMHNKLPQIQ